MDHPAGTRQKHRAHSLPRVHPHTQEDAFAYLSPTSARQLSDNPMGSPGSQHWWDNIIAKICDEGRHESGGSMGGSPDLSGTGSPIPAASMAKKPSRISRKRAKRPRNHLDIRSPRGKRQNNLHQVPGIPRNREDIRMGRHERHQIPGSNGTEEQSLHIRSDKSETNDDVQRGPILGNRINQERIRDEHKVPTPEKPLQEPPCGHLFKPNAEGDESDTGSMECEETEPKYPASVTDDDLLATRYGIPIPTMEQRDKRIRGTIDILAQALDQPARDLFPETRYAKCNCGGRGSKHWQCCPKRKEFFSERAFYKRILKYHIRREHANVSWGHFNGKWHQQVDNILNDVFDHCFAWEHDMRQQ